MSLDHLGDRMKRYEHREASRKAMPLLPVAARIDGKRFSKFTRGFGKPFDDTLISAFQKVARRMLEHTSARVAYTQSDEISLLFWSDSLGSQIYLDGKYQKMVSILASMATSYFIDALEELPEKRKECPMFDCRVWSLPNKVEALNAIKWRVFDCMRNSVSATAQCYFSHSALQSVGMKEKKKLLLEKGVDWDQFPDAYKYGTLYARVEVESTLSEEERAALPQQHHAVRNPNMVIRRKQTRNLPVPGFMESDKPLQFLLTGSYLI